MMESSVEPRKSPKGFFVVWWAKNCHQTWFRLVYSLIFLERNLKDRSNPVFFFYLFSVKIDSLGYLKEKKMPTTFFLLFGLMSLGFAAFTYFMFDIFIFSNYRNAKRCTERTEGVIIRYSYALYNGISLPVIEYTVDGNQYKVVGPKFLSAISNTISTPLGSIVSDVKMDNFEDGEIPQVLRYKIYRNSFISLTK